MLENPARGVSSLAALLAHEGPAAPARATISVANGTPDPSGIVESNGKLPLSGIGGGCAP